MLPGGPYTFDSERISGRLGTIALHQLKSEVVAIVVLPPLEYD